MQVDEKISQLLVQNSSVGRDNLKKGLNQIGLPNFINFKIIFSLYRSIK